MSASESATAAGHDREEYLIVYSDGVAGGSFSMPFDMTAYENPYRQAVDEAKKLCAAAHRTLATILVIRKTPANTFVRI